jgi:NDP-sugar pyrophosphorylase family protein
MTQKGERLVGQTVMDYWMDIGTPERYRQAQEDLKHRRVTLPFLNEG